MKDVIADVDRWRAAGQRFALATVVDVRKSAPRPLGSKMAVSDSGEVSGAVSGGCVEGSVVEVADRMLRAGGPPELLRFGIEAEEAWSVGLPCGGEIDVFVSAEPDERFVAIARDDGRAASVTVVRGPGLGARLLVSTDGVREGSLGSLELDVAGIRAGEELMWAERSELRSFGETDYFVDVTAPAPRLVLFGAVDFSVALSRVARAVGWRTFVIDPRRRFATSERFPDAERVIAEWPESAFAELGGLDPATAVAVLTHDPKLDDAALLLALESDAGFVGAMGSRTANALREERLLTAGVRPAQLERISAPIGLDLGGLTASETALSVMAEIVALRDGREGGRLTHSAGPIHHVGERGDEAAVV